MDKIKVGVFWVCDDGKGFDIIYDIDEYDADWRSDFGDEFIVYEKSHEDVWEKLAEKFFDGKYAGYAYDDFPRGRVTYDSEDEVFLVDCDIKLKPALMTIKPRVNKLYSVTRARYQVDRQYQSKTGILNKKN